MIPRSGQKFCFLKADLVVKQGIFRLLIVSEPYIDGSDKQVPLPLTQREFRNENHSVVLSIAEQKFRIQPNDTPMGGVRFQKLADDLRCLVHAPCIHKYGR